MAGAISQNPAEMTVGEYISENLSRMDPNSPEYNELKHFYDTQVKGQPLVNKYIGNVSPTFKDMFEKSSGIKFGELHTQPNQTEMQQPEIVTEARQSLVGSDPNKVDNTDINRQVNNIHNYDDATAAGEGRNTEATKQAQTAIRDSRKTVNENKIDGVEDIPETDSTSDSWYDENTNTADSNSQNTTEQTGDTTNDNSSTTTKQDNGLNKLLLADILMTGVRNALHYRPAFRTAYGEDIEGRDFGTEKSLAQKLAEENMKRGLERSNQRKDTQSQTEAEIEATKRKGSDKEYGKSKQNLGIVSGTQTTTTNETKQRPWGTTQTSTSKTTPVNINQNWNNVRTSN